MKHLLGAAFVIVLIILIAIGLTTEESPTVYEVEPDTPIHQSPS